MNSRHFIYILTAIVVVLLCIWPLADLGWIAVRAFSLDIFNQAVWKATANTLLVSGFTTLSALVLGTVTAYIIARTNLPFKNRLKTLLLYPYIIPNYLLAIGWIILANPTVGLLNSIFPVFNIYGLWGIVLVETIYLYTFVFLNVHRALEEMDGALEEAARVCGASPIKIFFQITIPLLRSTLAGSAVVVLLSSLSSFGVPAMIGAPDKFFVLTTHIYQLVKTATTTSLSRAAALSIPIIVLAYLLLYFSQRLLNKKNFKTVTGKHNRKLEVNLRVFRWPALVLLTLFSLISMGLPLGTIIIFSLMPRYGVWNFSWENYRAVLMDPSGVTIAALKNSLLFASSGAAIIAFLSLLIAYFSTKSKFKGIHTVSSIAALPYAIPGTIMAMAILLAFGSYNAVLVLLLAYVVKYLSFGVKVMTPAIGAVDNSLEEASLVCGATWLQTMRKIWLPVLRPALTTTCFLVFSPLFSELTMSILLVGPSTPVLGARLFQLQEYVSPGHATVLAVILLAVVLSLNFIIKKISKGKLGV